jgi:hypothetical protein
LPKRWPCTEMPKLISLLTWFSWTPKCLTMKQLT